MAQTVDKVPYIQVSGEQTGEYLGRYDETKGQFLSLADNAQSDLDSTFTELSNLIRKIEGLSGGNIPDPTEVVDPPTFEQPPELDLPDLTLNEPENDFTLGAYTVPQAPTLPTLQLPDDIDAGTLDGIVVSLPTPPSVGNVTVNVPNIILDDFVSSITLTTPPPVSPLVLPNKPSLDVTPGISVDIPDVSQYVSDIPAPPIINIGGIDEDLYGVKEANFSSIDVPNIPVTELEPFEPSEFLSCVKDDLCESIKKILESASLDKEYEIASYDHALQREQDAFLDTVGDLPASWASKGFMMPPGMLMQLQDRAARETQRRVRDASRDIYTRRRELDLQATSQAQSAGATLFNAEVEHYRATEQLKLTQLQFIQEQALKLYEQAIAGARLQEAKLSGERAAFEAYLEGKKARWDAEDRKSKEKLTAVELYKAQVSGIEARTRVAGVILDTTKAELEVQVETARAISENNRTLMSAWSDEVSGVVEGYKTQSVYADIIRAQATAINAEASSYQAKVQAKQLQLEAASKQADVNVKLQELNNSVYQTAAQGEIARVDAAVKLAVAKADLDKAALEQAIGKSSAIAAQHDAQARITSSVISASSSAYQAAANAALAKSNAAASYYNAISSYTNAYVSSARGKIELYSTQLKAQLEFYRGKVNTANDRYSKVLTSWNASFNAKVSALNSAVSKTVAAAQLPAEIIKSALSAFVINLGSNESVQRVKSENYSAQINNSYQESTSESDSTRVSIGI